jgi:hypothetical protein
MAMASESSQYEPSYRERDVDETLDDHDHRISRLEKIALVGFGYGLASGANIVTHITSIL